MHHGGYQSRLLAWDTVFRQPDRGDGKSAVCELCITGDMYGKYDFDCEFIACATKSVGVYALNKKANRIDLA